MCVYVYVCVCFLQLFWSGDSLYKEGVTLISEIPATLPGTDGRQYSTERRLVDWISRYVSSLLYVPDNPAQQPLHIFR